MKWSNKILFSMLALVCMQGTSFASETDDIIKGGRLYDKWWVDTGLPKPDETHPAYPVSGKKKGSATWRCKECHGWDYRGSNGAYAKGSHFTGIKGVIKKSGTSIKQIISVLKNDQHQFDSVLYEENLKTLALFLTKGQIDMDRYITRSTKKANGDSSTGKKTYQDNCKKCHGSQGNAFNLAHDPSVKEYIGTISNKNPWETLHKIRFGNPGAYMTHNHIHSSQEVLDAHHAGKIKMGEAMPSMLGKLSVTEQIDLLSYLQTLATK